MSNKKFAYLSSAEIKLVRETEKSNLNSLNEDDALALLFRLRTARNRALTQYRRSAARKVEGAQGRGKVYDSSRRNARKVEVLEEALSTVSKRVSKLAKLEQRKLKEERLSRARAANGNPFPGAGDTDGSSNAANPKGRKNNPGKSVRRKKRNADTLAQGARRQGRKDNR